MIRQLSYYPIMVLSKMALSQHNQTWEIKNAKKIVGGTHILNPNCKGLIVKKYMSCRLIFFELRLIAFWMQNVIKNDQQVAPRREHSEK